MSAKNRLALAASQGRAILAKLRGYDATDEPARESWPPPEPVDPSWPPIEPPERDDEREPSTASDVDADATASTLAALVNVASADVAACVQLALLILDRDESASEGDMADAWRGAERSLGLALALATHLERECVYDRTSRPPPRRQACTAARLALVSMRWHMREIVSAVYDARRWPAPKALSTWPSHTT